MKTLRSSLINGDFIVAPGTCDALGAMLIEKIGYSCVYISGAQMSSAEGLVDVGLLTMTEVIHRVTRICNSIGIPAIADADNGYGNVINLVRAVEEFERAGVSAIHIEDQIFPKKCARFGGKELTAIEEMRGKIKAALDSRRSDDFLIIARTDAMSVTDLDDAIKRGQAFHDAGADAVMFQSPRNIDDLKRYRDAVPGNLVITLGSWKIDLTAEGARQLGYNVVLFPNATMRVSLKATADFLSKLKGEGDVNALEDMMAPLSVKDDLLDLSKIEELEKKYASA